MLFKGQDTEMAKEVEQNAQDLDILVCHIKEKIEIISTQSKIIQLLTLA